jgi:hypothetical protein
MLEYKEYLHSKKIDADAFLKAESTQYDYLKNYFDQVSPNSFTAQKLFLINDLRRKYLYKEIVVEIKKETVEDTLEPKKQVVSRPMISKPSIPGVKIPARPVIKSAENISESTTTLPKPNIPARPKIPGVKIPVNPVIKSEEENSNEAKANVTPLPKPNLIARPKIPGVKIPKKIEDSTDTEAQKEEVKPKTVLAPKISALKPKIPPKKTD